MLRKCNCVSHVFEPVHSGSIWWSIRKSDRGMIPHSSYHPLFHIWSYRGTFVLSSEFIFSWDSENQWPSLMLFKYSHLECCPVSPNKSCFCARRSRQYFPRIQKQRVFGILTEQISDYIGFSVQEWFYKEVLSLISAKAPIQNFTFMNNKCYNNHDVLYNRKKNNISALGGIYKTRKSCSTDSEYKNEAINCIK